MPSKSKKQHDFMQAIAHSPKFAKKVGVPQSVGKDFAEADKGRKFGTGGSTGVTYGGQGQINKQRTRFGSKYGYKLNVPNESLNKYVGKADGGEVKEMAKGGISSPKMPGINKQKTHHGSVQMPNAMLNKYVGHKTGGIMKHEDIKLDKKIVKKAVGMHDKQQHAGKKTNLETLKKGGSACAPKKMAMGGMARMESKGEHSVQKRAKQGAEMVKMARGGGVEVKGKTKGTMIKMCGGGMKGKK